jgi:sulfite exporter TauE/SafE
MTFYLAIVASSLVGSLHCVAMCGPLVGLHGGARTLRLAFTHALGRLATYVTLGVVGGLVGRAVDLAPVQHAATFVAGGVIVGWGLYSIAVALGWRRPSAAHGTLFRKGLVQLRGKRPALRAWLAGALTGLLPCGWLWAFVIAAAGTASPLSGALVMLAFWLGTVPAMTGVLALGGTLFATLRQRMPVITACVLIGLGVTTLVVRASPTAHCHCHEAP